VPVLAVLAVVGWVAVKSPGPVEVQTGTPVTVMKPVEGTDLAPPSADMPIEVRYGVPSEGTLHLWPESTTPRSAPPAGLLIDPCQPPVLPS